MYLRQEKRHSVSMVQCRQSPVGELLMAAVLSETQPEPSAAVHDTEYC